jgi:hypothetical protein
MMPVLETAALGGGSMATLAGSWVLRMHVASAFVALVAVTVTALSLSHLYDGCSCSTFLLVAPLILIRVALVAQHWQRGRAMQRIEQKTQWRRRRS